MNAGPLNKIKHFYIVVLILFLNYKIWIHPAIDLTLLNNLETVGESFKQLGIHIGFKSKFPPTLVGGIYTFRWFWFVFDQILCFLFSKSLPLPQYYGGECNLIISAHSIEKGHKKFNSNLLWIIQRPCYEQFLLMLELLSNEETIPMQSAVC